MPLSRLASVRMLPLLRVLVLAGAAGAAAAAGNPAPQGCGRFTLEKIQLGATQAQVEALGIGKLEPLSVGTDESRFRVRPPKTKKYIGIVFHHDRVAEVTFYQRANAATAETVLADLRSRWGGPDKPTDTDLSKDLPMGFKWFTWSDRTCPTYGGYLTTGFDVRIVLSTSANRVKGFADEGPVDAR